jgi:beta-glucuronidase
MRTSMRLGRLLAGASLALMAGSTWPAAAAAGAPAPPERALYDDGPDGRYLLEQGWTTRADPEDVGMRDHWERPEHASAFSAVSVPHAFNAEELTEEGFASRVQWYRVPFTLPPEPGATGWRIRFESVNVHARAFLNGAPIGEHVGAHLPFELAAPDARPGANELVVRVDGRPRPDDLPPGDRPAGWWNHGGILREVYLRRVGAFDVTDLHVRAEPGSPARVQVEATARNTTGDPLPLTYELDVTGPDAPGPSARLEVPTDVPPGEERRISTSLEIDRPRLWSPDSPALYALRLAVPGQVTRTHFGVRAWTKDATGRVLLNGRPVSLRGASFHEDVPGRGAALTPGDRDEIVAQLRALGADVARQHYPPHPALLEAFDRHGIVFWEQIPVWRMESTQLESDAVRAHALSFLERAVVRDRNHASVMVWSAANEPLASGPGEERYLREAKDLVRRLDPSRFLAVDKSIRPAPAVPDFYSELDAIGFTNYIAWYGRGAFSEIRPALEEMRARFPGVALFQTEFGAEANRDGPASELGTYAFQQAFLDAHLDAVDELPWMNGAIVWLLRDYPVRPAWAGGNPQPDPPFSRKGLLDRHGAPKPAFETVRRRFLDVPSTREPPAPRQRSPAYRLRGAETDHMQGG